MVHGFDDVPLKHEFDDVPMVALPRDLLIDILCRIPLKPLHRFKCISKRWNALISSRSFAKQYHRSQAALDGIHKGGSSIIHIGNDYIFSIDLHTQVRRDLTRYVPKNLQYALEHAQLVGSCNGLLCFQVFDEYPVLNLLWLYNPTTGAFRFSSYIAPKISFGSIVYGFGYDSTSDDYKVLNIRYCRKENDTDGKAFVYSLKTNSWKRLITNRRLWYIKRFRSWYGNLALANNSLHWFTPKDEGHESFIEKFDLATEQFGYLQPPDEMRRSHYVIKLASLKGCMLMLHTKSYHRPGMEIWMMKEYGVKDSWAKIFDYTLSSREPEYLHRLIRQGDLLPCAYSEDGGVIIVTMQSNYQSLFNCDLRSQHMTISKLGERSGNERHSHMHTTVPWVASLVSPTGY